MYLQGSGFNADALGSSICSFGAIPAEVTGQGRLRADLVGPCDVGGLTWQALLTSMFLHGSWMHLIGNMWFMWIFGNNIEDSIPARSTAVAGGEPLQLRYWPGSEAGPAATPLNRRTAPCDDPD